MKQEDIGLIAGGNEIGTIYSNAIINIKMEMLENNRWKLCRLK